MEIPVSPLEVMRGIPETHKQLPWFDVIDVPHNAFSIVIDLRASWRKHGEHISAMCRIYHKKYCKELGITPQIEAYIQSRVLKMMLEAVSFERSRGILDGFNVEEEAATAAERLTDAIATETKTYGRHCDCSRKTYGRHCDRDRNLRNNQDKTQLTQE